MPEDKKNKKKKGPTEEQIRNKKKKIMLEFLKELESHEKRIAEAEQKILDKIKHGEIYTRVPLNIRQAAGEGNIVEVSNFLRKGFQVDETDKDGSTALMNACDNNRFNVATILIANGANVNHVNKHGFTPLMFAAREGSVNLVTLLLKHNANVKAANACNDTALHFASLCGFSMVCLLLRKAGGEIGVKNNEKKKPSDNANAFRTELDVTLTEKFPEPEVEFTKSKSIFAMKQLARELSMMMEES